MKKLSKEQKGVALIMVGVFAFVSEMFIKCNITVLFFVVVFTLALFWIPGIGLIIRHYREKNKNPATGNEEIIRLFTYFGGKVGSIAYVSKGNLVMTLGLILPGEYDFGYAKFEEIITIISGSLVINGKKYNAGDKCILKPENRLKIETSVSSSYLREYNK